MQCSLEEFDEFWEKVQEQKGRTIGDVLEEIERFETDIVAAGDVLEMLVPLCARIVVLYIDERSRPPTEFVASAVSIMTQYIVDIKTMIKNAKNELPRLLEEKVILMEHERAARHPTSFESLN